MGLNFFILVTALVTGFLSISTAHTYISTLTSSGTQVLWKSPLKLRLVGSFTNQSGLSPQQIWDATVISLQRWKAASGGAIDFDYWQGSTPGVYPSNSELNKISSLYFVSNSNPRVEIPTNVLGLTQVWYRVDTGEILETDMALNDRDFIFTTDPHDTSGYGGNPSHRTEGKLSVYLQNVIAHELGHALGLSHSASLQSTMLFMESPEQAHLSCDDLVGIHALYPSSDHALRGSILGKVLTSSGSPLTGAHVLAISQPRGTVLATAISDPTGSYRIDALEPGIYYLMIEPYYAGLEALPSYYSGMTRSFCSGGQGFDRSFLVKKTEISQPEPIQVLENKISTPPAWVIHCAQTPNSEGASHEPTGSSLSHKPVSIRPTATGPSSNHSYFGITDKIEGGHPNAYDTTYELPQISGNLEIHALAYSLYSPLHLSMSLGALDSPPDSPPDSHSNSASDSRAIPSQILDPSYVGESGFKNYDSVLIAEDLPLGNYKLRVTGEALSANDYPAGPVSLDSIPFILITGTLNKGPLRLEAVLPPNSRCRNFQDSSENFPSYSSPSKSPLASPPNSNGGTGFCATQRPAQTSEHNEHNGPPPNAPASILGWFLPWIFIFVSFKLYCSYA